MQGKQMISSEQQTIIEIHTTIDTYHCDEKSPYYQRTSITPRISSTTKFDRVVYHHLGFRAWSHGKRMVKRRGDLYTYIGYLETNIDAYLTIPPFKLCLENLGDSFVGVRVRLPDGMSRCKITILQEEHQPKPPKDVDDFVEFEQIWYASATINCLQTIRIEELKGETH